MCNKPNFFIVGAAKSGTTSIAEYLAKHPDVHMSPIKETNYFTWKQIASQSLYYNEEWIKTNTDYSKLFAVGNKKIYAEASVSYLFYDGIAEELYQYNPKAKILIILRNPVERAFSHYLMDFRLGKVRVSLEEILKNGENNFQLERQQILEYGLYYSQVLRYLNVFSKNQIHIEFFEDLKNDRNSLLKRICDFLKIDSNQLRYSSETYNAFQQSNNSMISKLYEIRSIRKLAKKCSPNIVKKLIFRYLFTNKKPLMSLNEKNFLLKYYYDDIQNLSKLLDKNLESWYCNGSYN